MKYVAPQPITRAEADTELASTDPDSVGRALIRLALHDPDWLYVESVSLRFLHHAAPGVRCAACIALAHTVRLHRALHREIVEPLLRGLLSDPHVGGTAEDTLDDIGIFLPKP